MRFSFPTYLTAGIASIVLSSWILTGCPGGGDLDDDKFDDRNPAGGSNGAGGSDGTGGGDSTGGSPDPGNIGCEEVYTIFETKCSNVPCHGSSNIVGLDLVSPGVEGRVLGIPAAYPHVADPENCPAEPELLVNPDNLDASLMLAKLLGTYSCGAPMPVGFEMSQEELDCVRDWVYAIAGATP